MKYYLLQQERFSEKDKREQLERKEASVLYYIKYSTLV